LQKRTEGVSPVVSDRRLCHACARRHTARVYTENSPV